VTKRIAFALRNKFGVGSSGLGKDVVSVIVSGQTLSPTLFYGIVAAGGVYSPSNLSSTAADLARQIRQGNSRLIVCSHETKGVAIEAAKMCGVPMNRVLLLQSKPVPRLANLNDGFDVISDHELDWERITDQERLESTLVCLLYSSGTSGLPKGNLYRGSSFPPLTDIHSCPYLAPQSGSPDCPLREKRSRVSSSARGARPNA
jgi:4-coumarate--CoA ligase